MVAPAMVIGAIKALAGNTAVQGLGMAAAQKVGNGIYGRIFGEGDAAEPQALPADLHAAIRDLTAAVATREEMAAAFASLQAQTVSNQRTLLWAVLILGAIQIATMVVVLV